jgi:hypothetical protein
MNEYYQNNKHIYKEYYEKNKKTIIEKKKKYNKEHLIEKREYLKKYRKTESGKIAFKKSEEIRKERHQQKINARRAVYNKTKTGEIKRPHNCELCGKKGKTQAHHWSYLPQYWLNVIWACINCHRRIHCDKP